MLPSPPLSVARRAATAAASAATRHLLPSVSSLILEPSLPSPSISRRRIRIMPLGERAPPAPLPPCGRSFRAAAGDDGVKGEVLALVVVSFYRFADFPDHADFRRPLKKLCEELRVSEEIPAAESLWEGECFVFDKRVSVEHGLAQGTHKLCYGCKQPISDKDMESPKWEYGVSCPYCFTTKSEEEKERARARQKQFETWGVIGGPDKGRSPKRLESVYGVEENKK
uniref:Uncharacterized protein n=1 Tax=Avena sativa TaxID=4498 RepID=A0ACD5YJJ7_AVESA